MLPENFAFRHEGIFLDSKLAGNVDPVLPTTEIEIHFKLDGNARKKLCYVVAEKLDFQGLIQIRITDKNDHSKMFISTVDLKFFEQLRQDQSLHVTFAGFVDNLAKLLADCITGALEISIVKEHAANSSSRSNAGGITLGGNSRGPYLLQFFERREFKNLTHLCLPVKEAPMNVVMFYMNRILESLQNENSSNKTRLIHMQNEIEKIREQLHHARKETENRRNEFRIEEEKIQSHYKEIITKLEENINKMTEERNINDMRYKDVIGNLQLRIDKLSKDNAAIYEEKMEETKKVELLQEETSRSKANIANLKEQNEKLTTDLASLKNLERKNEMHLKDFRQRVAELQEKLRKCDKAHTDLKAELDAEKKICQTKKTALEMATNEISNANRIISKQTKEMAKLRKTIDLRTEIALKQEQVINEKEEQINMLNRKIEELEILNSRLKDGSSQYQENLNNLKALADTIENKYNGKLFDLQKRIEAIHGK